jgi:uncharacterized protein
MRPWGLVFFLLLGMFLSCQKFTEPNYVRLGTGSTNGLYYPTGMAIARLTDKNLAQDKLVLKIEATEGTIDNINQLLLGKIDFAMAQSDRVFQAYNGQKNWQFNAKRNLRSVMALYPECFSILAQVDKKIYNLRDLKGKTVNLGNEESGQLQNVRDLLQVIGISENDIQAQYLRPMEVPVLLNNKILDASFYMVGHPNSNIQKSFLGEGKLKFLPIDEEYSRRLLKDFPYYQSCQITKSFYPQSQNQDDIPSIGVVALLITTETASDRAIYLLTKEIVSHLSELNKMHPAYQHLTVEGLFRGLSAPIHPAALRYYREAGIAHHIPTDLIKE